MSNLIIHPFHLVNESPWPIYSALGSLFLTSGMISMFHLENYTLFILGFLIIISVMFQWWRDISFEGSIQGFHSSIVELGLCWGMLLFIISEIFFFLSFFWSFFHSSLSPNIELGGIWPPMGILVFNPFQVPLLNTIILISSGISITWAHHSMIKMNYFQVKLGLMITIGLGIYFSILQGYEYFESSFSFADSIYGSIFFIATGFHGLHVIIGTIFLIVCLFRHMNYEFSNFHHFGFEAAAWYWHFVDIVWLFLYLMIYWWGGV